MSKAITIATLTCFLVLGAATTAILGRDSVPAAAAIAIEQTAPDARAGILIANRAAKADRLSVPTLALAAAAVEPVERPISIEPLRQAFAAATPSDFPMPKASTSEAPPPTPASAEVMPPPRPKPVAKPQSQKSYALLSEMQIAGIKERLRLSSSQEYYWPSVETALRKVARRIQANNLSNPHAQGVPIDPDCQELQELKSAAMPLLFQLRDDQKEEVRKLARIIGLDKVAQQI